MRVLDLFAGLGGWGSAFTERGHEVVSIDFDERFDVTLHADVFTLRADELVERFGRFDIVLASPPCERFSVLQIGRNWTKPPENAPKTAEAARALELVAHTVALIEALEPLFFIIENPRAKLRRLAPVQHLARRTVTYCQYGAPWAKPTDLWGGFPPSLVLAPTCSPGDPCYIAAPRGSRTAVQGGWAIGADSRIDAWIEQVRRQADSVKRGRNRDGHVNVSKVLGSGDRSALRAIVPHELSVCVCVSAERDLEAGLTWRDAAAGRLFS